jgi:hypothetical protein
MCGGDDCVQRHALIVGSGADCVWRAPAEEQKPERSTAVSSTARVTGFSARLLSRRGAVGSAAQPRRSTSLYSFQTASCALVPSRAPSKLRQTFSSTASNRQCARAPSLLPPRARPRPQPHDDGHSRRRRRRGAAPACAQHQPQRAQAPRWGERRRRTATKPACTQPAPDGGSGGGSGGGGGGGGDDARSSARRPP